MESQVCSKGAFHYPGQPPKGTRSESPHGCGNRAARLLTKQPKYCRVAHERLSRAAPVQVSRDRQGVCSEPRQKAGVQSSPQGGKYASNIQPLSKATQLELLALTARTASAAEDRQKVKGGSSKTLAKSMRKIITSNSVLPVPVGGKPKHTSFKGLHRPIMLVFTSGYLLGTVCQLSATIAKPVWLPTMIGTGIGIAFTMLNRFGMRRVWREPQESLNVVITGSTRGIGKAIARELLKKGDRVMISSSNPANVRLAMKELRAEVGTQAALFGIECDVSSPGAVQRLVNAASSQMGSIDVWINNAGCSGRYQEFVEMSAEQIQEVVQTNLLGSLLCTRAAWRVMRTQPQGGHIFNIDGAGADGLPTPQYAAYGATKAGIAHLMGSLNEEIAHQGVPIGVHTLSPGMVLTPLLLEGATGRSKAIFNILCEQPETVAAFLAPRVRTIAARGGVGKYIRFLTVPRALLRFLKAPFAANRFFSKQGEQLYLNERERILSPSQAKVTRRLALNAARQDRALALAYSLSLAFSYALLVADAQGVLPRLPGT